MSETVNQETNNTTTQTPAEGEPKTFTQAEVDGIVAERLKRERSKYEGFDELKAKAAKFDEMEEANKSELQKATEKATALQAELDKMKAEKTISDVRTKVATEKGVPVELLTATTEEDCAAQAQAILDFAKPGSYPNVRDGGEVNNVNKPSTRTQFADWANKAFT